MRKPWVAMGLGLVLVLGAGGLQTVNPAHYEYFHVLGIYATFTVHVYGD